MKHGISAHFKKTCHAKDCENYLRVSWYCYYLGKSNTDVYRTGEWTDSGLSSTCNSYNIYIKKTCTQEHMELVNADVVGMFWTWALNEKGVPDKIKFS